MKNLEEYNRKRDFSETREPKGKKVAGKSAAPIFVVQRHEARRLHYDFRLEIDGALKSWAVPKGPSLYPKDKRLAVQVEDHPMDYAGFEGSIPKGNYGAGEVMIFDSGTFSYLEDKNERTFLKSWEEGNIKFVLNGTILKGEFALVRMKGKGDENWLLIKHADAYSVDKPYDAEDHLGKKSERDDDQDEDEPDAGASAKMDGNLLPMLAKLSKNIPDTEDWIYEKKFDGFRALAAIDGGSVKLVSRNGNSLNGKFPSLVKALKKIPHQLVLDGEIVIEDQQERSQFQYLQSGEPIPMKFNLRYYVFDLLYMDGSPLHTFTLNERKEVLELLMKKYASEFLKPVAALEMPPNELLDFAAKHSWEGIIAKLASSTYKFGKRNDNWLKIKLRNAQEAIICGFTKPQGGRSYFGALVLGVMLDGELRYIGNCGTGFTESSLKELHERMVKQVRKTKPFSKDTVVANERTVTWLAPTLVCEVYYSEWTMDRHLRHPVFKTLRTDKDMKDVKIEDTVTKDSGAEKKTLAFGKKEVALTNLNKVYWPDGNITKGEMLAYYEDMADYILPYLKDKPISMRRFPDGVDGKSFFHKDVDTEKIPSWLKTTSIISQEGEKQVDYLICNDKATLLYIANLGSIEIHPWLSDFKKIEQPEFGVLDLDPNGASWEELIDVANTARGILDEAKIDAFIKTSGSTGLHIFFYVGKKFEYEIVRNFVQLIAEFIHAQHPETTSLVRDTKKRKGLIYIDFLQNRRGQTVVAPYSLRAKAAATVSTPLDWEEVTHDLRMEDFTIQTIQERIGKVPDPWADIWDKPVDIKKVIQSF